MESLVMECKKIISFFHKTQVYLALYTVNMDSIRRAIFASRRFFFIIEFW